MAPQVTDWKPSTQAEETMHSKHRGKAVRTRMREAVRQVLDKDREISETAREFGITRTGSGYAIWTNPVSIMAGDNNLNLSPQPVTEINSYSDE